jgi:phage-related protein
VDAGRWIIEGLWNGITGALSWFGDKLASVATFIVENKGPKAYDLKLLEPAGGWIMQGLSAGIENSLPGLKSTLDSVTDTIESLSPTASSAYTYAYDYAGVGSGYALGGTTYNVYVDGARINDDEGIQNNLLELLLAMKRKGEMNVG